MNKSADEMPGIDKQNLEQLLETTDELEGKLREIQSDLGFARHRIIEKVIQENWLHCLTIKKSVIRRQIYRTKYGN